MSTTVATINNGKADISDEVLEELRMLIRGPIQTPTDEGPGAREVFNAMHPGSPALTIGCTNTSDVVAAVTFARERDLLVAVRGGGHSIAGLSAVDGGLLIDLAEMRGVHVDPERKIAYVQGGAVWADADRETQAFALATPGGVVSDTGVAGLTLGGGYGWLRRKYGLSCDNLLEAQVVCADGSVKTASATSNPDLYWGIRGGGGNFGIVTSFTFQLYEVGPLVGFAATFYPVEEVASVMRNWRDFVEQAPDEITSVVVTMTFPADPHMPEAIHDRGVAIVGGVHSGSDPEAGLAAMQPLRELGTVLFDMSGPTPWVGVQSGFDPLFPRMALQAYWKSQYLDELPDAAIDLIAEKAQERPAPLTLVNTFHMGGAIAKVDPEATAFAERSAPYMVSIDGMWDDPAQNDANVAWVRGVWESVK
jgi:FAD/FMN-containing dehydrogenase